MSGKQFYTYLYLRADGSPYYVGKGHGRRFVQRHRVAIPKDKERIRILPMPDEGTALAYEIYLIDFWGRKDNGTGILRNLTDGGDGVSGFKNVSVIGNKYGAFPRSEATRQRLRIAGTGKKHTEATKQLLSDIRKTKTGWSHSTETRRKIGESHKGTRHQMSTGGIASLAASNKRRAGDKRPGCNTAANHNRWHLNRGVVKAGCSLCSL